MRCIGSRPFSRGDKEKGFRDALIAEAFAQLVAESPVTPKVCRVALVTGDVLLSEAVTSRTQDRSNVRLLGSIEELEGLIDTLVSEVSEEFIADLKEKAGKYFYQADEPESIYTKEKVWEQIRERFAAQLQALPEGAAGRDYYGNARLGPVRFSKKESQRVFWITRLSVELNAYRYEDFQSESGAEFISVQPYLPFRPSAALHAWRAFRLASIGRGAIRLVHGLLQVTYAAEITICKCAASPPSSQDVRAIRID